MSAPLSPADALRKLGMTPTPGVRLYGDVIEVSIPGVVVAVFAGDVSPNCVCGDDGHRVPGCPQNRDLAVESGGTA